MCISSTLIVVVCLVFSAIFINVSFSRYLYAMCISLLCCPAVLRPVPAFGSARLSFKLFNGNTNRPRSLRRPAAAQTRTDNGQHNITQNKTYNQHHISYIQSNHIQLTHFHPPPLPTPQNGLSRCNVTNVQQ